MGGNPGEGKGKEHTIPAVEAVASVGDGNHADEGGARDLG